MAAPVWDTIEKFRIVGRVCTSDLFLEWLPNSTQITAFVMDNATNNDTLVAAFERRCILAGISFSARDGRMQCMPHTIHLSALKVHSALLRDWFLG
jgi:hypothetical protein